MDSMLPAVINYLFQMFQRVEYFFLDFYATICLALSGHIEVDASIILLLVFIIFIRYFDIIKCSNRKLEVGFINNSEFQYFNISFLLPSKPCLDFPDNRYLKHCFVDNLKKNPFIKYIFLSLSYNNM